MLLFADRYFSATFAKKQNIKYAIIKKKCEIQIFIFGHDVK